MKKAIIALALAVGLLGSAYFVGTAIDSSEVSAKACTTYNCD